MLTETLQSISDWLTENVCSKIKLKLPDDYRNDDEYAVKLVNPVAFPLYVPGKDRLPPNIPAPIPSVCVQLMEGTDNLFSRERILNIRLVLACWNPGTHGDEIYWPRKNTDALGGYSYFLRDGEELQTYERNMDGWKDSMNFQNLVLNEVEKSDFISKNRVIKENGIKFGLFSEDGDICDYYPYWHSWITFQIQTGLGTIPEIYYKIFL